MRKFRIWLAQRIAPKGAFVITKMVFGPRESLPEEGTYEATDGINWIRTGPAQPGE